MSLQEFARIHQLGSVWIDLRCECNRIVARPDYWYRKELQDSARKLAVKASNILVSTTNKRT